METQIEILNNTCESIDLKEFSICALKWINSFDEKILISLSAGRVFIMLSKISPGFFFIK